MSAETDTTGFAKAISGREMRDPVTIIVSSSAAGVGVVCENAAVAVRLSAAIETEETRRPDVTFFIANIPEGAGKCPVRTCLC